MIPVALIEGIAYRFDRRIGEAGAHSNEDTLTDKAVDWLG